MRTMRIVTEAGSGIMRGTRLLRVPLLAAVALLVAPTAGAIPFGQTRMIIEVNATDGDAGIQLFLDAEGWSELEISDPNGEELVEINASGGVGMQGLTELFAESAEPSFEDQSLAELFDRFPEGKYTFRGTTVGGKSLSGSATFKHSIPAGPDIVSPSDGEALDSDNPTLIDWAPVTSPFPGTSAGVTVVGYQVIVERLKPQPLVSFSVNLPSTVTQVTVSPEFMQPNAEYRVEVLAIDASGNQTISERDFQTVSGGSARMGKRSFDGRDDGAPRLGIHASPNPAAERGSISFSLASESRVRVSVFDVSGRLVRTLVDGNRAAGRHDVAWDLRDTMGRTVSRGIYFTEVVADGVRERAKLVVAR